MKKNANGVCEHCHSLGLTAYVLQNRLLQEVGNARDCESLGLIQVAGQNIKYINSIIYSISGLSGGTFYYLVFIAPLKEAPLVMCHARLWTKKGGFLGLGKVADIKWLGDSLANTLNNDLALKESLITDFRRNKAVDIEISPEPFYQCVRLQTIMVEFSGSLFDCLDRIAGLTVQHVTALNTRPEKDIFKSEVMINPDVPPYLRHRRGTSSKQTEVTVCHLTDRKIIFETVEPLHIPLYQVDDCDLDRYYGLLLFPEVRTRIEDEQEELKCLVTLKYRDQLGYSRKIKFELSLSAAETLQKTVNIWSGISR